MTKYALTYGMTKGWRRTPINVAIRVQPMIKRKGPPVIGTCFFDAQGRLIYIVSHDARYGWHWRRVFTDGTLSTREFHGHWDWKVAENADARRGKASTTKNKVRRIR